MPASCAAPAGTSPEDWVRLGVRFQDRSPERAVRCFIDAALADPLSHEPKLQLGLSHYANGLWEEAAMHLDDAGRLAEIELNSSAASAAFRALGNTRLSTGHWNSAGAAFRKVLKLFPGDCLASAGLANALSATDAYVDAAITLRAALAEDHACPLAHHGLARLLGHTGDLPGALRHARAALELRPFDGEYEHTLHALLELDEDSTATALEGDSSWAARDTHHNTTATDVSANECGAPTDWSPPAVPTDLAPTGGGSCMTDSTAPRGQRGRRHARRDRVLLVNPFEEGCFHDDLKSKVSARRPHTAPT